MTQATLDLILNQLSQKKTIWAEYSINDRIPLFEQAKQQVMQTAKVQVELSCQHKCIPNGGSVEAEEWLAGPVAQVRNLRLLIETFKKLSKGEDLLHEQDFQQHSTHTSVQVFPSSAWDKLAFPGFSADVWLKTNSNAPSESLGKLYTNIHKQGCLTLVLGAGNVSSIPLLDALYFLSLGHVVLLKLNPVNDYLKPIFEEQLQAFIELGFVNVCKGDTQTSEFLCHHPAIDHLHMTGNDKTHDAICFGVGESGRKAKQNRQPILDTPMTCELGNVTPVIVCPGEWTSRDLKFQAHNVASQLVNNAGFNCIAPRMLILHNQWALKDSFLKCLQQALANCKPRVPFYPGAQQEYQRFTQAHKARVLRCGEGGPHTLPWALIEHLREEEDSITFKHEFFGPHLAQVSLDASSFSHFLGKAVAFANDRLWGTLAAEIILDPCAQRNHAQALDKAIEQLNYGVIAVNHWPGLVYALGSPPWGSYPGNPMHDIQSGQGFVHNTLGLTDVQKTVLKGPFRWPVWMPKPLWFARCAQAHSSQALLSFEASPNWLTFTYLVYSLLRH